MVEPKPSANASAPHAGTEAEIRDIIEILYRMNSAWRISKIYNINNTIFVRQIKILHQLIQKNQQRSGELTLKLRQSSLTFSDIKLKFSFSNYYLLKFINEEFSKRDIGEISFVTDITKEELTEFILLLAKNPTETEQVFKDFSAELIHHKIKHIHIGQKSAYDDSDNPEKAAVKIFELSITHLKEMFEKKEDSQVSLTTTKRLMQSVFNNIVDNESFFVGLTNIKNFDEYTLNHSVNVCILSIALGKKLGLERKELVDLGLSAFFHDFGKLEIPKDILLKPGKLDPAEREIIEHHPHYGAEKLIHMQEFSYLPQPALNVAMEHHTNEDNIGYPKFSEGKKINFFSKIVKIVDFFDAVTTKRPYREKDFSRQEALQMMEEQFSDQFDPIILKVFSNMMGSFPVGTLVLLDTSEIGIVYEINPEALYVFRPKVKLITDAAGNIYDGEVVDLAVAESEGNTFSRSIVKALDTDKYKINTADYFVVATI